MAFVDPGTRRRIWDSGRGPQPCQIDLADGEVCHRGDVLGYDSGWKRAIATTGGVIQGRLVALANGSADNPVPVSVDPAVDYDPADGEELTPSGYVYVAEGEGNDGKITQTAPSTGGDANTIIGIAVSDKRVVFFLNARPDSTA